MSKNWKPETTKKLDLLMHGNRVVAQKFKKGQYKKEDIKKHVQQISDAWKKAGHKGEIGVGLLYEEGWKGGYLTSYGAPIIMYEHSDSSDTMEEPEYFTNFTIYYTKK